MEHVIKGFPLKIRERSILHFMGYPMKAGIMENPRVKRNLELMRKLRESHGKLVEPAALYRLFRCSIGGDTIRLEGTGEVFVSSFLASRFRNAAEIGLFVATIGSELEDNVRELLYENRLLEGMILDAIGSEAVEAAANHVHSVIQSVMKKRLVRFSPGFDEARSGASWKIKDQERIFRLLDPERIGLSLSPACMMKPRKSVSAIIGEKYQG